MGQNILGIKVILLSVLMIFILSFNIYAQQSQRDLIKAYKASVKAENDSIELHYKFLMAASDGDIAEVNRYIKEGINIDYRDGNGTTALFYAVDAEHSEIVKTLLYYGANTNIKTFQGFSPLMNACGFSFPMAELLLLVNSTKIDLSDGYGTTALHYAAYYGQHDIVDMLIFYGADVSKTTQYRIDPTYLASFSGNVGIMNLLIAQGADPFKENNYDRNSLDISILNNDSVLFDYLSSQAGYEEYVKDNFEELLKDASYINNTHALVVLLENDSVGRKSEAIKSAYKTAYNSGNSKIVDTLRASNYPDIYHPIIKSVYADFSTAFNGNDYCSYFGLGINDTRYNMNVGVKFGTRFKYKSFLDQIDDNSYYQHWERRNTLALSIKKSFSFYKSPLFTVLPYVAVDAQLQWARYRGRDIRLKGKFILAPEVGVGVKMSNITFSIGYQYINLGIYDVSPHRVQLGIKADILIYPNPQIYYPTWM